MILKSLRTLDKRLESDGYEVEWKEFQAGPAIVEAVNAGSIDFEQQLPFSQQGNCITISRSASAGF
ncbi:hypothetical protein [Bacillus sp. V33-4]|uniref:hypothetical protein n=1 Tax=Bacillus sp. V33-4 TaxID=2054169 RepID=UPI0015E0F2EA|nr:hypothetical protein [Bacillus sp. V33-4]